MGLEEENTTQIGDTSGILTGHIQSVSIGAHGQDLLDNPGFEFSAEDGVGTMTAGDGKMEPFQLSAPLDAWNKFFDACQMLLAQVNGESE